MEEEKRLELRLGPPGDQFTCSNNNTNNNGAKPNKRVEAAPVVGWPPVRSFRRNLAGISGSTAKATAAEKAEKDDHRHDEKKKEKEMYVKINMEGVPIGRKVNLSAFTNYQQLSTAVDHLFSALLAVQMGSTVIGNNEEKTNDQNTTKDSWDLNRQYTLVYEDTEGDRVLVGDVPWEMFVSTVKRLHVLKTSEVSSLSSSRRGQERGQPSS